MIAGKGQTKQRLFQFEESIQDNGTKLPMNNSGSIRHSIKILLLQHMRLEQH